MKAELPTEEDVLAFLVLNTALGLVMIGDPASVQPLRAAIEDWQRSEEYSVALEAAAHARLYAHGRIHVAAIADSERRLDCERARDAVLAAASAAQRVPHYVPARDELWQAVRTWRTALFRINPTVLDAAEVSRHGG